MTNKTAAPKGAAASQGVKAGPGGSASSAPKLSQTDFSEIEHYIDCLESANAACEKGAGLQTRMLREHLANVLRELVGPLEPITIAGDFILCVSRVGAWGGNEAAMSRVRQAFSSLCIFNAGHLASEQFTADGRAASVEHGKLGGRPSLAARGKEWFATFERSKAKAKINETPQEVYEQIAANWNEKGHRKPVTWKTVRKEIGKHRNSLK